MLKDPTTHHVTVKQIDQITADVKRFTLVASEGGLLPAFSGGSHILVHMKLGEQRFTNAYSLMNSPAHSDHYQIAVLLEAQSKGGSEYMHKQVQVGDALEISAPKNLFGLAYNAHKHIFIAGGIGITPILSQLEELCIRQADFQLHYAFQRSERGPFADQLRSGAHQNRTACYAGDQGQRLDVDSLLSTADAHTHIYVCGPTRLIDAVLAAAKKYKLANESVHTEQFGATTTEHSGSSNFIVTLAKSGREVVVAPGITILSALEKCGISDLPFLCRSGVCGTCETNILEGEAEHCDQYLTPEEKAANKTMMVCVSRSKTAKIILDL
jgi:ferredoxin-NADP reductase